jgi:hypothetical protein
MRRGVLAGVAGLLALAQVSCGSWFSSASSSPAPSISSTPVGAPDGSASARPATPLATTAAKDRIVVRSLGVDASFTETSCADSSLPTVVPSGATIIYADCGAYWRFVASESGPLGALLSAPVGTQVEWVNGAGLHTVKALNGSLVTVARDPVNGQFPGHGAPPGAALAFIQLRNGSQQTELAAK